MSSLTVQAHGANIDTWKKKFDLSGSKILDFSASLNPLGPPGAIKKLLRDNFHLAANYPQDYSQSAREKIAQRAGIGKSSLLITNGSIEAIYLTSRLMTKKLSLIVTPTFSEYERAIKMNGGRCLYFNTTQQNGFRLNIDRLAKKIPGRGALFICNPNNPTGTTLAREDLFYLAKKCARENAILVVDEAFIDFLEEPAKASLLEYRPNHKNIIVLGSLTKFFALAGLRIGYITAHKKMINRLSKFCFPWAVNSLAQDTVISVISETDYINRTRTFIKKEKDFLFKKLSEIGQITPFYPSVNFILCRINNKKINSKGLFTKLARQGIFIRDCSNFRGLNNSYFRVAVKTRRENKRLLYALKNILTNHTYAVCAMHTA